jgi:hypothetical protein
VIDNSYGSLLEPDKESKLLEGFQKEQIADHAHLPACLMVRVYAFPKSNFT